MSGHFELEPLIALAQIGRIEILHQLHPHVLVPPAVAKEVAPTIPEPPGWLLVRPLAHPRQPHTVSGSIGPGEHVVISLGLELGAERLILDEQPARRLATSLGLRVIGTVGLLLAAKDRGFLANQDQARVRSAAGSQVLHGSGTLRSGYRPGWRVIGVFL